MRYRSRRIATPHSVYADELSPDEDRTSRWVVLLHGGGVTGDCWLSTPDGRTGWAHLLVRHGYRVLVPDWPNLGRSRGLTDVRVDGHVLHDAVGALLMSLDAPAILVVHSMAGPVGFRLLETHREQIDALVAVTPGAPGNVQREPAILDETEEFVDIVTELGTRRRLPKVGDWSPPTSFIRDKYIGYGSRFPTGFADQFAASVVPIPSEILLQRQNVDGSQLRVVDPASLRGRPVLIVTGDSDQTHTRDMDGRIHGWLAASGVDSTFVYLEAPGYEGNAHMLMSETNSDAIAELIVRWLHAKGLRSSSAMNHGGA